MINKPVFNKVVITTVPFVDDDTPLAAPAMLKSVLNAHSIECVGLDLNIDIYNKIKHHPHRQKFLNFFYFQIIEEDIVDDLVRMLDFYVTEILSHKPDLVGLSLFSNQTQTFALWLCAMLRQRSNQVKIIIGGPGLQTLENSLFKYPDRAKKLGLIDDYITGDADQSLVQYCFGNKTFPGINSWSWQPSDNFQTLPVPDYSDYRFLKYNFPLLPIVDSRGCVQDCEFCDVIAFWNKFQYLTAEAIFERMTVYIATYGLYRFQFSSSICNGNLREFKKLVKLIAKYNSEHNSQEHIHWVGSFIIRSASQHPESMWQDIKHSNGFLLTGVESVVERVRIGLGKKFTNLDLEHHLSMTNKYQIPMNLLLIAGYPTETDQDLEDTLQWFRDHAQYANNTVEKVQVTLPGILPGTKLEKNIDIEMFRQRQSKVIKHRIELTKVLTQCGFNVQVIS